MLSPGIRNVLNTVVSDDDTTFGELLELVFYGRCSLSWAKIDRVPEKPDQRLLAPAEIFSLEKHDNNYVIRKSADNSLHKPDGTYFFIVPTSSPYKILCAQLVSGVDGTRKSNEGHTSFTGQDPVHFAGMIKFIQGRLDYWNNGSGHFTPAAEKRHFLLPHIKLLLPEHLFRPYSFAQKL